MQVESFHYQHGRGWSVKKFPLLDSPNTLILAFCAPEFLNNSAPLEELKRAYPKSKLAGCSTSGEIYNQHVTDNSISVAVIKFDKGQIQSATANVKKSIDSFEIGKNLGYELLSDNLRGVLLLSDGLNVNGSSLVNGLKFSLPNQVVITGGLAGDGSQFKNTWVLKDGIPSENCICAIGFYGNIDIGYGSKGGWDSFGPERLITRSIGNVLYEIDGENALQLYKKYLGEKANNLPSSGLLFPLAIKEKPLNKDHVVRTILSINEKDQSIVFAGDIPQGWYAQFMKANFDRLIEGASIASHIAKSHMHVPKIGLGIAISCVGRRLVLGERAEEELEATQEMLGEVPVVGFYSYGEISPSGLGNCDLHNQTMTITTLSES